MKKIIIYLLTFFYFPVLFSQSPSMEWQKSLGGTNHDYARAIAFTSDGGCIIAGESYSTNGDVTGNHGEGDYWVVKLDIEGEIEWQKCLGGSDWDRAKSIVCASDGGYIVAGTTRSADGDVSILHGQDDVWLVKLDEAGNIIWEKTYGNEDSETANCIARTSDNGYVIAGTGGPCNNNQGYIIKINANGEIEWEKEVGGNGTEALYSIKQDPDKNYVFAGYSQSYSIGGYYSYDFYVGLLDSLGNLKWHNRYGGNMPEKAYSVEISHQGGYIIAGQASSNNGNVTGNNGGADYWIIDLDKEGNLLWQKCYGGTSVEWAHSIKSINNNEYIVAGKAFSNDGNVSGNHGKADFWILKINQSGNIIWKKTYGGSESDIAQSIDLINNSDLVITGMSWSEDGDVTGHHGSQDYSDFWTVKLSLSTGIDIQAINKSDRNYIFPNPTNDFVTIRTSEICIYELVDINGKLLRRGSLIDKEMINLTSYNNGVYFIILKDLEDRLITTEKILKR